MKYIKWFEELRKTDIALAGGIGANLGELVSAKIPVPPGFVVLASAYDTFLDRNNFYAKIKTILDTTTTDIASIEIASEKICALLASGKIPAEISKEIIQAYDQLGKKNKATSSGLAVAIRSSSTDEDSSDMSFAGHQESYLNIAGDANVLLKIKACWQSLFSQRSISYSLQKKLDQFKISIAVPVQMMVPSEVSGVMFTVDPISNDKDKLIIEAAYGLGEYVVQGIVTPDHIEISKSKAVILSKHIAPQEIRQVQSSTGVKQEKVPKSNQTHQKLSDEKLLELAQIGKMVHQHYFFPQDIEWAYAADKLFIIQTRPITSLDQPTQKTHAFNLKKIVSGVPAAPGLISGPVRIVPTIKTLAKVKSGDILVAVKTTDQYVSTIKRAAAIITTSSGLTSHAAIAAREYGIPCVVGAVTALQQLTDGMIITINGTTGEIYAGTIPKAQVSVVSPKAQTDYEDFTTATKVLVTLAQSDLASDISKLHIDGIGLLQAEHIIADIGIHPKKIIADGKHQQYIDRLASEIGKFCEAFFPRPVLYRASDFKTNEYINLKGGQVYEPEEVNPALGLRGASRYTKMPEVFSLELEALKKVRNKMGHTNVSLMIPYVSTCTELAEVKRLVSTAGLHRSATFKLIMMVETPASVVQLEEFIAVGIDAIAINTDTLTMLTLGIDKENTDVAPNFDERDPAVLWMIEKAIKTATKHKIASTICGSGPSHYPDMVEKLVTWGIGGISVSPDAINRTRQIIHHAEKKFITGK